MVLVFQLMLLDLLNILFQTFLLHHLQRISGVATKSHAIKIGKIYKYFELYQHFMHSFLCQNVSIFPLYILLTRRTYSFWSKSIHTFRYGRINTIWAQKSYNKNQHYSQRFFELH